MLVAVKTLEGRLFKVEAAPESTIGAFKGLIEASQPARRGAATFACIPPHPRAAAGASRRARDAASAVDSIRARHLRR